MNLEQFFGSTIIRYTVSGMLILLYAIGTRVASHRAGTSPERVPGTLWMKVTLTVSMVAYYALIPRYGGAIWSGFGNLLGVGLVGFAIAYRLATAKGSSRVRHPESAARLLFLTALPLAVGVPLGWLALSLPAFVAFAINSVREDKILGERLGDQWTARMAKTHRLIPGIW